MTLAGPKQGFKSSGVGGKNGITDLNIPWRGSPTLRTNVYLVAESLARLAKIKNSPPAWTQGGSANIRNR